MKLKPAIFVRGVLSSIKRYVSAKCRLAITTQLVYLATQLAYIVAYLYQYFSSTHTELQFRHQ